MFGKWHLSPVKFGPESLPFYPDKQGFTHHFVIDKPSTQANPELDVWIITGDGDALSIGGNHTLHLLRRNLDVQLLLFNNEIYGLTKGQYSPTSRTGTRSPSSPNGSLERPASPCAFAIGAGARFIARTIDTAQKQMPTVLKRAHAHKGASFVEIYQNCVVYNDGVFEAFTDKKSAAKTQIWLEHGQPMLFGNGTLGLHLNRETLRLEVIDVSDGDTSQVVVHDETNKAVAAMLVEMPFPEFPVALGVLYCDPATSFDAAMEAQKQAVVGDRVADFNALLLKGQHWEARPGQEG